MITPYIIYFSDSISTTKLEQNERRIIQIVSKLYMLLVENTSRMCSLLNVMPTFVITLPPRFTPCLSAFLVPRSKNYLLWLP